TFIFIDKCYKFDFNVFIVIIELTNSNGGITVSNKKQFKLAVIPGDGVGTEVINEGERVLDYLAEHSNNQCSFEYDYFPWGCEYYLENGKMMAEDGLEKIKNHDAIYFGAVGYPGVPDHISLWGLRIAICQGFDQWANIRP